MEVEFGNLLKAGRGEEVFYCFSEAREKFFSSIGDDTLNNALEYLGVETLACNEQERNFFEKQLPHQTGPFRLIGEQILVRLRRHLLYSMQFQRNFPPLGYQFPFPSNYVFMGNFPFTPLPGQFRLGKDRNQTFSSSCTNNESGQSFSTGESDHQSQRVVFSELGENRSRQVQCKYGQEENEDCATRFPNNEPSACATKSATDKSDVRQVISSDLEENRSGPIQCTFEEENTAEHSSSRLCSKNYASPSEPAASENDVPSIQCVRVESRSSQLEKEQTPSHRQERSVLENIRPARRPVAMKRGNLLR